MPVEKCPIKIAERNYCRLQGRSLLQLSRLGLALRYYLPDRRTHRSVVRHLAWPLARGCDPPLHFSNDFSIAASTVQCFDAAQMVSVELPSRVERVGDGAQVRCI
jgi:hypothetical protein